MSQPSPDLEKSVDKSGDNTKRRFMLENQIPANLLFEENKKIVKNTSKRRAETMMGGSNKENEGGGMYYEEFAPNTIIKNTNIYSTDKELGIQKERVTTRASTAYKASPL